MSIFRRAGTGKGRPDISDDQVLDVAVRLLSKNPSATLADIGRRARVDTKHMHERFTSLENLVELAVMRGARRIARSAFLEDGTPAEQIALLIARLWDDQQPVVALALRGVRGPLLSQISGALAPVRDLAADAVVRGAADGALRSDAPPATVALLIEQVTVACLEHGARARLPSTEGRTLAMRQALSVAGLSWTEAGDVVAAVSARLR